MSNVFFQFKKFTVQQDRCAMKVTTDACLFGAWAAEKIRHSSLHSKTCLDIGTGTGLLPLMLAQKNADLCIDTIEIDEAAAMQAAENISNSHYQKKITSVCDDVKKFIFQKQYDVIISNPPFYEKEINSQQPEKNRAHHNAGLTLLELLEIIQSQLNPTGHFFLLLPYKRKTEIKKLFFQFHFEIRQTCLVRPSTQHDYFRIMLEGSRKNISQMQAMFFEEISIKQGLQYTKEFTELLQDYYLYL